MRTIKGMKSLGKDIIFLKGSRQTVWRVVYTDGERYWMIWYGEQVELHKSLYGMGYGTNDEY